MLCNYACNALKMTFYFRFLCDNREIDFRTKINVSLRVIYFSFQSVAY